MARNAQLVRQHKILEILERYRFGRTLEEIRDELVDELALGSLHTRSVRRDLEALQAAGLDVGVHDSQRGRIWKLGPRAKSTHKITATSSELIALSLSRDLLYPLAGTQFWQGIESFWKKVQEELPASVWKHYEKYRRVLHVLGMPAKSYAEHQGTIKTLNRAIVEHRVVEIDYQPIGRTLATRRIEPLAIVFYQSSLYIIAADHDLPAAASDRIRHWKLDRFQRAVALDEWFSQPEGFDVNQYLAKSVGIFSRQTPRDIRVRISQRAAPWVLEDPWHPEQRVRRESTGDVVITVPVAHEMEIVPRVLALGVEAEILSPASCRKRVAETVRALATQYETS